MFGSILLLIAIVYVLRRARIQNLQSRLFSHVPAPEFERWRHYELLSIDVFLVCDLVAAYSLIGADFALLVMAAGMPPILLDQLHNLPWPMLGLVLLGLVISASYGSKAALLRRKYAIKMPQY